MPYKSTYFSDFLSFFMFSKATSCDSLVIISDCLEMTTVECKLYITKYTSPNKNKNEGGFLIFNHLENTSIKKGLIERTNKMILIMIHIREYLS
jgi:hypothetical protein